MPKIFPKGCLLERLLISPDPVLPTSMPAPHSQLYSFGFNGFHFNSVNTAIFLPASENWREESNTAISETVLKKHVTLSAHLCCTNPTCLQIILFLRVSVQISQSYNSSEFKPLNVNLIVL